jgi:PAS domain S-box-containing protein
MTDTGGWSGLFSTAFERSRNAMLLTDDQRAIVAANPAFLVLVGRRREEVHSRHVWEFVADGPLATPDDWSKLLAAGRFTGEATLVDADGTTATVQWAASTENVTGRRLVLFVVVGASRWGGRFRRGAPAAASSKPLTPREREIVHLVALGAAGPEIADDLRISHETVRTHVRNAMTKVGARSRAHLVAKALGEGLTGP